MHATPPATIPGGSIVDTYLRDSGGEGQDRSVSRQLEAIKEYCLRHNLKLRHIYKDAAKSGCSTVGRDSFDRMIASTRSEADRPVAILLWNYARFARDLDDSTYYKALLRSKRNIIIHSLTDHIPEGPYGRFVEILIDISNEEKRRQTSIDTKDGLRSIVAQGAVPGVPPRGFKRQPIITINPRTGEERKNHRWIPDPKYINRIRKAFQMRAAGSSLAEIQKACKLFTTVNSYATFWRNPLYYGTLVYAGITFEIYCEPIIQKSLWDKVQLIQQGFAQSKNIKTGDRNHPRRQNSEFILSGLAHCARCGSPLYGRTSHQKSGYKYQSYLCTLAYRKRGACTKGRIPKPAFEAAIINAFARHILEKNNVDEMHRLDAERQAGLASEQQDQRREVLIRIASNKKQLTNIINAITENGSSPALQTRLKELELQKLELDLELSELEQNMRADLAPSLTPEQFESGIKRIASLIQGKDPAEQKTALRGVIARIDVERLENTIRGTIYYYLPNDDDITGPSNQPPPNGDDDVPTSPHPSGPPVRRHIMQYHFIASTKRPPS
jgi:DNA invertase Pin-like site-specific DNA recombinase